MTTLLIIGGIVLLLVLYLIIIYNKLVSGRNKVKEAWSDISVQMKRRYDLVPNLVEMVKSYMSYEQETLERVVTARNTALASQGSPQEQADAENMLTGAISQVFALSEAYPDLKASEGFLNLQKNLSELENHLQKARRFYNGNVRDMNTLIESFPSNLIANKYDFKQPEFFELDESEAKVANKAPEVTI